MSMNWKPLKGGEEPSYGLDFTGDKGMTKQGPSAACDINQIVARYHKTGFLEHVRKTPGNFADVSQIGDFHAMVQKVGKAREIFARLPAVLRGRFHNDPSELVAFMSDPKNRDEGIELGLITRPVKPPGGGDPPKDAPASAGGRPVVSPPVRKPEAPASG